MTIRTWIIVGVVFLWLAGGTSGLLAAEKTSATRTLFDSKLKFHTGHYVLIDSTGLLDGQVDTGYDY